MLDYVCGKRLPAALPGRLEALERHEGLESVRAQLLAVSAATIDRILAPPKKKGAAAEGRCGGPSRGRRCDSRWRCTFVEVDLGAHEGGNAQGDYAPTKLINNHLRRYWERERIGDYARDEGEAEVELLGVLYEGWGWK